MTAVALRLFCLLVSALGAVKSADESENPSLEESDAFLVRLCRFYFDGNSLVFDCDIVFSEGDRYVVQYDGVVVETIKTECAHCSVDWSGRPTDTHLLKVSFCLSLLVAPQELCQRFPLLILMERL